MKTSKLLLSLISLLITVSCTDNIEDPGNKPDDPFDKSISEVVVKNDVVYVGGAKDGLYIFENDIWRKQTQDDGLLSNNITALDVNENGVVALGTSLGISILKNDQWSSITTENGLFNQIVHSLVYSQGGDLWIGTGNNRLTQYNGSEIIATYHVNPEESGPVEMGHIHTICFDKENNIWVGSCISGLSKFDGLVWTDNINNFNVFVESSVCANNGDVWIGHITGAYQYKNNTWIKHDDQSGLIDNMVLDLSVDKNDNIWAATQGGLAMFDGFSWTNYTVDDGLPDNYVTAVACDENGVWVGTSEGLFYFEFQ